VPEIRAPGFPGPKRSGRHRRSPENLTAPSPTTLNASLVTAEFGRPNVPAECLACASKVPFQLSNPQGPLGNPLGVCSNCRSLACGAHGHRDPNIPEFVCVQCDPHHVAASAAFVGTGRALSSSQRNVAALFLPLVRNPEAADRIRIKSLADFIHRRPGYDEKTLREGMSKRFRSDRIREDPKLVVFSEIPPVNWDLLKLAAVLAKQLGTNLSRSPPEIVALAGALG